MPKTRYTYPAISLHWLIAILILIAFSMGLIMSEMSFSPLKLQLISWHKWMGVTVFGLALLRLLWRLTHAAPPTDIARWEKTLAYVVHVLLYFLLFAVPLTGWLMSSAKGFQTVYFGVLAIPNIIAKNPALGETLAQAHALLNWIMAGIVVLHFLGALKHHFLDRNDVLTRMLPILKPLKKKSS